MQLSKGVICDDAGPAPPRGDMTLGAEFSVLRAAHGQPISGDAGFQRLFQPPLMGVFGALFMIVLQRSAVLLTVDRDHELNFCMTF